jgi:hypothetical protein
MAVAYILFIVHNFIIYFFFYFFNIYSLYGLIQTYFEKKKFFPIGRTVGHNEKKNFPRRKYRSPYSTVAPTVGRSEKKNFPV